MYYICIIHLYNIYPLSQGRQAPPTRLTVDSRRRHTLARRSMSLPLKKFSSQDKLRSAHRPPSRHRRHRDHHTRMLHVLVACSQYMLWATVGHPSFLGVHSLDLCLNLETSQWVRTGLLWPSQILFGRVLYAK